MRYLTEISVPKNTLISAPTIGTLTTARGMITKTTISFLNTINGTVKAVVMLAGQQLYPANAGTSFILNQSPIEIVDNYPLFPKESSFELRAWSNGNNYPHTIQLGVDVIPFTLEARKVR